MTALIYIAIALILIIFHHYRCYNVYSKGVKEGLDKADRICARHTKISYARREILKNYNNIK